MTPTAIALLALFVLVVVIARAVRGASTDMPRTPGGDDHRNGWAK